MKIRVLCVTAVAILFWLASALLPPDGMAQEAGEAQAESGEQETGVVPAPAADLGQTILATLGSDPVDYNGPCPAKITFVGTISVTRPCEVHYRFVRSDGESASVKGMNFVNPGSREVITSWQVEKDYSGWQVIEIVKPQEVESNKAYFTVKCEGAADAIQPEEVKDEAAVPAEVMDDDDDVNEDDGEDDDDDDNGDDDDTKPGGIVQGQEKGFEAIQVQPSGEAIQKVESLEERMAKLEERVAKLEEGREEAKKPAAAALPVAVPMAPAAVAPPATQPEAPPMEKAAAEPLPKGVTKLVIRNEPEPVEEERGGEPEESADETLEPAYQYYKISGTPLGAGIYEGETLHGNAPMTLRLSSERHTFTFKKDGFKGETRELGVSPGGWIEVTYTLEPEGMQPETPLSEQEATPFPDA